MESSNNRSFGFILINSTSTETKGTLLNCGSHTIMAQLTVLVCSNMMYTMENTNTSSIIFEIFSLLINLKSNLDYSTKLVFL